MIGLGQPALKDAPEWVPAEMPPGYRTRLLEIERLSADLRAMDAIARLLWESGEPLRDAVARVFGEFKCEVEAPASPSPLAAKLNDSRRLLLLVSGTPGPIHRTHEEVTHAFQAVQFAGADDRVVLVAHIDPATPPADRPDAVSPDALHLLERTGVTVVTSVTLFRLWRLWLEDQPKARKTLERLHAQEGGLFVR